MTVPDPEAVRWTEREILDRLSRRHNVRRGGNGPEWVYMEKVRDQAGAWANRTIDALALHLWPSRHHEVHAYEVKVSRADFRRELAGDMAKSEPWTAWVEYFWIVAPAGVVPRTELPAMWGLLETSGVGLRVAKSAKRLRERPLGYMPSPDLPRSIVAAMLRSAARLADELSEAVA